MAKIALPRPKGSGSSKLRRHEAIAGFAFVLPWVISLLVFTAYPVLASFYYSFTQYSIVQAPKWIGLDNYVTMFTADPAFKVSVYNSAYYAFLSVPLGLLSSLGLALLLNMRVRFIGGYRTLFYLASLTPPVAGTIIFIIMFQPRGGLINGILALFGIQGPAWFTDPNWSKPGLILLSLWGVGAGSLIFLAGLKDIPAELLEAASIDGANAWQRFWRVTIPLLSPVILYNLVTGVIASFQVFTSAMVIGGTTGRPQESLLMYFIHLYRNAFRYFNMGYASALAVVLFIAVLLITLLIFRSATRWVFYEGELKS
ncbi:MAG: sugar ABC transporter permease [Anaerolineae bacterium]|nr:sugar ABC transporter permease [Candidatus Roseilinea sp.]MDW8451493.1 sugar ABC transporter permease [Anaerolineae bacterium]